MDNGLGTYLISPDLLPQVGLSSNHSPSKVCPKCEPHLASTAGSSSVQQGIPREPSFTRKKKLLGHEKQVTFTTDYTECGGSAVEVRPVEVRPMKVAGCWGDERCVSGEVNCPVIGMTYVYFNKC